VSTPIGGENRLDCVENDDDIVDRSLKLVISLSCIDCLGF